MGCIGLGVWGFRGLGFILSMIEILHYVKDPILWPLWYIPYSGYCRIYNISRRKGSLKGLLKGIFRVKASRKKSEPLDGLLS